MLRWLSVLDSRFVLKANLLNLCRGEFKLDLSGFEQYESSELKKKEEVFCLQVCCSNRNMDQLTIVLVYCCLAVRSWG